MKHLPFAGSKKDLFHTKNYWKHTDKSTCCKLRSVLIKYHPLKQITKYQCSCSKHGVFFLLPSSHLTPQFLYSSSHNSSIQHDFQAAWFYFCEPMKQEKKEASTYKLYAMPSLSILNNIWKVLRFSVKYMCM